MKRLGWAAIKPIKNNRWKIDLFSYFMDIYGLWMVFLYKCYVYRSFASLTFYFSIACFNYLH